MGKSQQEILAEFLEAADDGDEKIEINCWHVNSKGLMAPRQFIESEAEGISPMWARGYQITYPGVLQSQSRGECFHIELSISCSLAHAHLRSFILLHSLHVHKECVSQPFKECVSQPFKGCVSQPFRLPLTARHPCAEESIEGPIFVKSIKIKLALLPECCAYALVIDPDDHLEPVSESSYAKGLSSVSAAGVAVHAA